MFFEKLFDVVKCVIVEFLIFVLLVLFMVIFCWKYFVIVDCIFVSGEFGLEFIYKDWKLFVYWVVVLGSLESLVVFVEILNFWFLFKKIFL